MSGRSRREVVLNFDDLESELEDVAADVDKLSERAKNLKKQILDFEKGKAN